MYYEIAKIESGVITEYPITKETINIALEAGLSAINAPSEELSDYGIVPVKLIAQRMPQDGYDYVFTTPTLVNDVWEAERVKDENTLESTIELRRINLLISSRRDRDLRVQNVMWRVQRYERNKRLNITQVDDLVVLDTYIQDLANLTLQDGFPFDITWPTLP